MGRASSFDGSSAPPLRKSRTERSPQYLPASQSTQGHVVCSKSIVLKSAHKRTLVSVALQPRRTAALGFGRRRDRGVDNERGLGANRHGSSLGSNGMVRAVLDRFEVVAENRGRHLEHADHMGPIVRCRDLDPTGKFATADPNQIA